MASTVLGIGLAMWARYRAGPYACIRHPIYSGVILALLGTALVLGEWRGLFAVAVLALSWFVKARKEEALLSDEFGPAFEEHRSGTGRFFPRFR